MKRFFPMLLIFSLLLTLCACGNDKKDEASADPLEGVFSLGYSRVNITPTYSVPLAGYGNTSERMSKGMYSYLYTTCTILTDETGTSLVLFQNDLASCTRSAMDNVKKSIAKETNIPFENVMVAGTHTHSGPDLGSTEPSARAYQADIEKWMMQAFHEAMDDRAEVTEMTVGRTKLPANTLNFIRHYTTQSGIVKGDNFGDLLDSPYTGHVRDADTDMQLIRFQRKGDAKAVTMLNWQTHPHRSGGSKDTNISADLVGSMRDKYEKETGELFIYFTGASGNVNPSSRIEEENITSDFKEQGQALADYALDCLEKNMAPAPLGKLQILWNTYAGKVNHSEDHLVDKANLVMQEWTINNNFKDACTLANKYGINSPYHANGIMSKSGLPDTFDVKMSAFCIGDSVGFIACPFELYSELGEMVKEGSPFEYTIVITCSNDSIGYIPSIEGYENNSYEANTSKFEKGSGERIAQEYVKLLKQLNQN